MESENETSENPKCNVNEEVMTRDEYIKKLSKWLEDARLWHSCCAGFPYYNYTLSQYQTLNRQSTLENHTAFSRVLNVRRQSQEPVFLPGTAQYTIAPLWKRMVAELLDFLILLLIKLTVSLILLESFNVVNLDFYGIDSFQNNLKNPKIAMKIYVELLVMEFFHKIIVCIYEAYFLKGGMCSTPGKRYMGLIVIHAENIDPANAELDERIVNVGISRPLGLKNSIIRSVLKNVFIWLLLPIFSLYIFRFNRTGYDMVANSLVVEYNPNRGNRQAR